MDELGRGLAGLDRPMLWEGALTALFVALAVGVVVLVRTSLRSTRRSQVDGSDHWVIVVAAGLVAGVGGTAGVPDGVDDPVVVVVLGAAAGLVAAVGGTLAPPRTPARPLLDLGGSLIGALGLYGMVPDTEGATALVGAIVATGLVATAVAVAGRQAPSVSWVGAGLFAMQLGLVVVVGVDGPSPATLASVLVIGVFLATTAGLLGSRVVPALAIDLVVTGLASRWAGLADGTGSAAARGAVIVLLGVVLAACVRRPDGR